MRGMRISKLDLFLLCTNLIALGGMGVLIALRGPSGPSVLLAAGAALMVVAKIGKSFSCKNAQSEPSMESEG